MPSFFAVRHATGCCTLLQVNRLSEDYVHMYVVHTNVRTYLCKKKNTFAVTRVAWTNIQMYIRTYIFCYSTNPQTYYITSTHIICTYVRMVNLPGLHRGNVCV